MVAPMFITFSLHWLFCYLFLCDLRHIYHLPINLTVVRIKVIGCGLKAEHGNIMDVLFFCFVQRYESFPSPKTAYS